MPTRVDAIIIGGGPAGSSAAIGLSSAGIQVVLLEKRAFPRETLCGEFLSHEVTEAIRQFGLEDEFLSLGPRRVTGYAFVPEHGRAAEYPINFEAWSLKRSLLDQLLLENAKRCGTAVVQPADVVSIERTGHQFDVCYTMGGRSFSATTDVVIAAYGKQSRLDRQLNRSFTPYHSSMGGVKYHVPKNLMNNPPDGQVQLFAADGIYCGVSTVSREEVTLCALVDGASHGRHPMDGLSALWRKNRKFHELFNNGPEQTLRQLHPYGAGDIYFGRKNVVENGIYMIGDAAGMIAPLAGDGIGMAIESGRLVAHVLVQAKHAGLDAMRTGQWYEREWRRLFRKRVAIASGLQRLAMNSFGAGLGGALMRTVPVVMGQLLTRTRGGSPLLPKGIYRSACLDENV